MVISFHSILQALQSHAKTNCLMEPYVEAEELAEACDQAEDKSRPLHGVPVSIKECIGHKVKHHILLCSYRADYQMDSMSSIIDIS